MKVFVLLFEYDKFESIWSTREKAEERIKYLYELDEYLSENFYEIMEMELDSILDV